MISFLARRERTLDLRGLLSKAGLKPGATVMVHAAWTRQDPHRVVELMKDLVSPGGTLLMPAYDSDPLSLDFRCSPETISSIHPTHPVAAWGRHARTLLSTHHLGGTFDTQSPFYRLREVRGIVVGIGCGLESFAAVHCLEELHDETRRRVFEKEVRTTRLVENGETFEYAWRPLKPGVKRDYSGLEAELLKKGILRYQQDSDLRCASLKGIPFLDQIKDLQIVGLYPQAGIPLAV